MDKDKYKLGKTRDEKPEGFYDTDQIFEFFKKKKFLLKEKIICPDFVISTIYK